MKRRFAWRATVSVFLAASFVVLVLSGGILFVSPPGRIANWTNWTLLGLRKHDWIALHVCFSALFLFGSVLHLLFNWRPLLNYFRDRVTRRIGFRWEWLTALALCGAVWAGTRLNVPPFSTLLALSERAKESWDQARDRAPVPHAELLTLRELAEKAGVDLATATNRLAAKGFTHVSPDIVVGDLGNLNQRSAQQVYQALRAESPGGGGQRHGQGQGRGGGRGGGGGGGPGRKTLAEFCADEGLAVEDALARLRARGLKASADSTLREIAVNNGFSRPYEVMDILRGK